MIKLFLKKFSLNYVLLKKFFREEYSEYLKLKDFFKDKKINKEKLVFYYPGCGGNISGLLFMYDILVGRNKKANFILVDTRDMFPVILDEIKRYTNGKVKCKKNRITVYFKDREINIIYRVKNALEFYPSGNIDVYYERAFEMFRIGSKIMERIYPLVNKNGLMITDHSFEFGKFKDDFEKIPDVPFNLGLYRNFQIWKRK